MELYDIGDIIRMNATFTGSGSTLVNPGSVNVQYRRFLDPPGSVTTLTTSITNRSTCTYYRDLDTSSLSSGEYRYRVNGFGVNAGASEKSFKIRVRSVGGNE
jgi:hypothetical protein